MSVKPIQLGLPFKIEGDAFASTAATESPVGKEQLMELILLSENLQGALKRVKQNKGAAGVDNMGTEQLHDHLKQHWTSIKQKLLEGTYHPQPVKRVEIPKPDGRKRLLGIPTVLDRFIQQAMLQILQEQGDRDQRSREISEINRRSPHGIWIRSFSVMPFIHLRHGG